MTNISSPSPTTSTGATSSPILAENLVLADLINIYVREKVPLCINYIGLWPKERISECRTALALDLHCEASLVTNEAIQQFCTLSFEMLYTDALAQAGLDFLQLEDVADKPKYLALIANVAEEHGLGTCSEMCAVGLAYCQKRKVKQSIELFQIKGGRHCFLVLGRDKESKPHDYKHWGKECVICDPWKQEYYLSSEIPKKLCSFQRQIATKDGFQTILEPFDPKTQTLESF